MVLETYPFFTLHNHEHSVELIRILSKLNKVSNGIIFNELNMYEFYVLIMAIYFHDLGMLYFNYDDLRKITSDEESRKFEAVQTVYLMTKVIDFKHNANRNQRITMILELFKQHKEYRSNYTRKNHHLTTSRFHEISEITQLGLGTFVKMVCNNHGLYFDQMNKTNEYINGEKLDIVKISTFLRFADSLDNCKNRVSNTMYQSINKYVSRDDKDDITISHWAKHLLIDSISYKFDSKSKIILVILNFNEKINTSLKTVNNKESNIEIDYSNKMIYKQVGKKYHSSLFEKFIDEYFLLDSSRY